MFGEGEGHVYSPLQLGSTRSRLYLDCVTPADAGHYQCVAQTSHAVIVSVTTLEIGK